MKKKILIGVSGILLVVVIIVLSVSYMAAHKTLHKPRQQILKTPADYGLKYEDIEFNGKDNLRLKGWWIEGNTNKVVIVAHGYAACRAGWLGQDKSGKEEYLDWLTVAPYLVSEGYSMLYFDFRASGKSEGDLISLGKYETNDMISAIDWQLENKGKTNIGLLGFSMGANVVLRTGVELKEFLKSKKIDNAAIIAIGPYIYNTMVRKSIKYWTSLPTFFTPFISKSASIILGFNPSKEINPVNYVDEITPIPLFFIQSEKDEIGDVEDVQLIYDKAKHPKHIHIIQGAKRFVQYNWPSENPETIIEFYNEYLEN